MTSWVRVADVAPPMKHLKIYFTMKAVNHVTKSVANVIFDGEKWTVEEWIENY